MRYKTGMIKISVLSALLLVLPGCAQQLSEGAVHTDGVLEAYNTSRLVPIAPYTRTIFSSSNF